MKAGEEHPRAAVEGTDSRRPERDAAETPEGGARAAEAPTDSALSLIAAFGGVRGMIDMTVPGLVFVIVFTITRETKSSSYAAVAVAGVLAAVRLARRETLMHALGGFLGVAIAAYVAVKSGKAENFYLLGVFISGGYALAYVVSIMVRWPIIGVVLGPILGENFTWRKNPERAAAYTKATWVWVALFVLRIVVQVPLYLADEVTWLGAAKVALGVPPWLVAIYLTWLIMSKAPPPTKADDGGGGEGADGADDSADERRPDTGSIR
ncbi:DUF3159 domain-containing protein [Yinghuangia sp. ASG 101]|uniref:DUF3159 domain-containing protein n=1 Tax=Yinghuangia sp. ASG 101 TaxID=2896848 RepID=UPI001E56EB5A|nr:DUF3159 domain-containing protein [Yinghuangia sp. ASG 101]UGQ13848.1 DUF3159 domain-containing protein [Yinghuangia sp. ASG 101]